MRESKEQEKIRMIKQWQYYKNSKTGEIAAVFNTKNLQSYYGAQASFILWYMRKEHGVCLIPILE